MRWKIAGLLLDIRHGGLASLCCLLWLWLGGLWLGLGLGLCRLGLWGLLLLQQRVPGFLSLDHGRGVGLFLLVDGDARSDASGERSRDRGRGLRGGHLRLSRYLYLSHLGRPVADRRRRHVLRRWLG